MDRTKPFIICAAIHYTDYTTELTHQPSNIQSGLVLCGRRHHNIIEIYHKLTNKVTGSKAIQGFMTSTNRFVDRKEAMQIAKDCGQVPTNQSFEELFSEDIY